MKKVNHCLFFLVFLSLPAFAQTTQNNSTTGVWFSPAYPLTTPADACSHRTQGSNPKQFSQLFDSTIAQWPVSGSEIKVFLFFNGWIEENMTVDPTTGVVTPSSELQIEISALNARGIAIALSMGPLDLSAITPPITSSTLPNGKQTGVCYGEGFTTLVKQKQIFQAIQNAGGVLAYFDFDEPYNYGSLRQFSSRCEINQGTVSYSGPETCGMAAQQVASGIQASITQAKTFFPNVIVGDTEPLSNYAPSTYTTGWLGTPTGQNLSFFHLDVNHAVAGWQGASLEIEKYANQNNIKFGMIYDSESITDSNGDQSTGATNDYLWLTHANDNMVDYEVGADAHPDMAIFQSWDNNPYNLLPETWDLHTFSNLLLRYFRARTTLSENANIGATATISAVNVTGILTANGLPLPGGTIQINVETVQSPGTNVAFSNIYNLPGSGLIIPSTAVKVAMGVKLNSETADAGVSDPISIGIDSMALTVNSTNLIPSGSTLAASATVASSGWNFEGRTYSVDSNITTLILNGDPTAVGSTDWWLQSPTVSLGANQEGQPFKFTVVGRIPRNARGKGHFVVDFLSPNPNYTAGGSAPKYNIVEYKIPFEISLLSLGTSLTLTDGSYSFSSSSTLPTLDPTVPLEIKVDYGGDISNYWPAEQRVEINSP